MECNMTKVTFKTPEGVPVEINAKKVDRLGEGINDQSTRIYSEDKDVTVLGTVHDVSVKLGLTGAAAKDTTVDYTADANTNETVKLMPNTAPVNPAPIPGLDEVTKVAEQVKVSDQAKADAVDAADEKKADDAAEAKKVAAAAKAK
jgi:hypothetical protein